MSYVCPKYSTSVRCRASELLKLTDERGPGAGWHLDIHVHVSYMNVFRFAEEYSHKTYVHFIVSAFAKKYILSVAPFLR